jgi:hypothetical protein
MDLLKNYTNITDNNDALITTLFYDKCASSIIKILEQQLEKAKNISNPIKKHKMNNRLYNLIKFVGDNFEESQVINSIFLVHDNVIKYDLSSSEISTAKEYKFENMIKNDEYFLINYLLDLFLNFEFVYSIKINKNDAVIKKFNKNKEKELENIKINNESAIIDSLHNIRKNYSYKDYIIIYGNSPYLNKIDETIITKNKSILKNEHLNNEKLYETYENEIMKNNIIQLEKRLNDMKNDKTNLDLYLFGKLKFEIKDAIESYSIKELYIEDKKLEKLKTFVDESYFNFKIYPIKIIGCDESGILAQQFMKDYNGIMGIKYY